MISSYFYVKVITSWQIGKKWKQWQIWAPKSLQTMTAAMELKDAPWKKSYDKPKEHIKTQRHHFANKGPCSQSYGFSSSHVWMWELDHKESWESKSWCFQIVVLGKTLEGPLDCKEIKPVNPKENQLWILIGKVSNTLAHWCKEPAHWKRPSCWEILKAKGEGGGRGWDD